MRPGLIMEDDTSIDKLVESLIIALETPQDDERLEG